MYTAVHYIKAESLEQAWELNQKKANAILGGGCWMRLGRRKYNTLIDLSGLGLDQITPTEEGVEIGAMVTLREVETSSALRERFGTLFQDCTRHIVGVQFRNCATFGGSVNARFGFSDILPALLALDTQVELYKGGLVGMEEFSKMPYGRDLVLGVKLLHNGRKAVYETMRNSETDIPVLTCALSRLDGKLRCVIGARPGRAVVLEDVKEEELVEQVRSLEFGDNMRASAQYRRHLAGVLAKRALGKLKEVEQA